MSTNPHTQSVPEQAVETLISHSVYGWGEEHTLTRGEALHAVEAVAPAIRADERETVTAELDGCLSSLLARGRIDERDRDEISRTTQGVTP